MSTVVESFGTDFVITTISREDDGTYRWTRRPGPARSAGVRPPDAAVLAALRSLPVRPGVPEAAIRSLPVRPAVPEAARDAGWVELALPERVRGDGVSWLAAQRYALAALFVGTPPDDLDDEAAGRVAADTLEAAGAALARLHACPLPPADLTSPNGPERLLAWLRGGRGPAGAPELYGHATRILGDRRLASAEAWCQPQKAPRPALLHGAPANAILLPMASGADGCLLTGEDLACGAPESDVGWLAGELVELRESTRRHGRTAIRDLDYDALLGRLLTGYAASLDLAAVGRTAALRVLTHIHDFAAYVSWNDALPGYLRMVADVIDEADAATLLGSSRSGIGR